jgi:DNA-binding XRE family transcriptional regulator
MINDTIRYKRIDAGLSRKQLADKVSVTTQFIYQLENGEKHPRLDTAKRIADALNCTVDEFCGDCQRPTETDSKGGLS